VSENSNQPSDPNQPVTEKFAHAPVGARVPDKVAPGVYSTAQIVLDSPKEFVMDFLQGLTRPYRVNARVVVAPATMAELITALKENLQKYTNTFGAPPPLPQRPPNERRLSITEIYENFKIPDELLAGCYANSVLMGHSATEFFFDFITGFYPTAAVSARIFLPAPVVPRFLGTLEGAWRQYMSRLSSGNVPKGGVEVVRVHLVPMPRDIRPSPGDPVRFEKLHLPAGEFDAVRRTLNPWLREGGKAERDVSLKLGIDPNVAPAQGYRLRIGPGTVDLTGADAAGLFYAAQTLAQLLTQRSNELPLVEILDHPDFPARGVMLDVSRDKVPTMQTLFELVDLLASWKINQLQLYTEHTFAYRNHETVWKDASPMTAEEIRELDEYCGDRFIDLVPNQNSFGHMERWFKHPEYLELAEAPNGYENPWRGFTPTPTTLCPGDPRSIELLREMFAELLPNFSSKLFNVGCDETWDLGQGRSKEECERRGKERVYLDFILNVYALVKSYGRTMQFWGDIIMHRPELIPELPKDVIALEWGYEADHPFDADGEHFAKAGVPFYVCPGTSSWNTITGRTDNALGNLRNAAVAGMKHGAIGFLNTDWGDNGHLQYLPISYLPFAAGAAMSWCEASSRGIDYPTAVSLFAFGDPTGTVGRVVYDLGNAYLMAGSSVKNGTILFRMLMPKSDPFTEKGALTTDTLAATIATIDATMAPLASATLSRPDAELIRDELRNAAALAKHGARCGRWRKDPASESPKELAAELRQIIAEHKRLWLARNRPGGLSDSCARLEALIQEYESD
jgi:hypothetical protein